MASVFLTPFLLNKKIVVITLLSLNNGGDTLKGLLTLATVPSRHRGLNAAAIVPNEGVSG